MVGLAPERKCDGVREYERVRGNKFKVISRWWW